MFEKKLKNLIEIHKLAKNEIIELTFHIVSIAIPSYNKLFKENKEFGELLEAIKVYFQTNDLKDFRQKVFNLRCSYLYNTNIDYTHHCYVDCINIVSVLIESKTDGIYVIPSESLLKLGLHLDFLFEKDSEFIFEFNKLLLKQTKHAGII